MLNFAELFFPQTENEKAFFDLSEIDMEEEAEESEEEEAEE